MKVKTKILHKHHTIPVGASIDHIEWHLTNLWNGGYTTIRMMTPREHIKKHKKLGYKRLFDSIK